MGVRAAREETFGKWNIGKSAKAINEAEIRGPGEGPIPIQSGGMWSSCQTTRTKVVSEPKAPEAYPKSRV